MCIDPDEFYPRNAFMRSQKYLEKWPFYIKLNLNIIYYDVPSLSILIGAVQYIDIIL